MWNRNPSAIGSSLDVIETFSSPSICHWAVFIFRSSITRVQKNKKLKHEQKEREADFKGKKISCLMLFHNECTHIQNVIIFRRRTLVSFTQFFFCVVWTEIVDLTYGNSCPLIKCKYSDFARDWKLLSVLYYNTAAAATAVYISYSLNRNRSVYINFTSTARIHCLWPEKGTEIISSENNKQDLKKMRNAMRLDVSD